MFEPWYCLCGGNNENCPRKDTCLRATDHGPGIYTFSCFYKEGEECTDYIPIDEENYSDDDLK